MKKIAETNNYLPQNLRNKFLHNIDFNLEQNKEYILNLFLQQGWKMIAYLQ